MNACENFKNALSNLELGWTNQWAFIDQREQLLLEKTTALKNKKALLKEGYDVVDIYKQLDEFNLCIRKQAGLTNEEEEKILLAALYYAENNRPIISSRLNNHLYILNNSFEKEKSALRYKYDVYLSLISFYLGYKKEFDLFNVFLDFLNFNEFLLSKYPNENQSFYSVGYTIIYLKFLIKVKKIERVKYIFENYTLNPIGKTDTANLEKIKEIIYKE